MAEWYSIICMFGTLSLFFHDGYLGFFYVLSIINSPALSHGCLCPFKILNFTSLDTDAGTELPGRIEVIVLNF